MNNTIGPFVGTYAFLSNFAPVVVEYDGVEYRSVEHAYQAAKTFHDEERRRIARCETAGQAKRMGRTVHMREDWPEVRIDVMLTLLRRKFAHPDYRHRLMATESREIVEINGWGDTFWGVCRGNGENHLGKLLMQVREEIRRENDAESVNQRQGAH